MSDTSAVGHDSVGQVLEALDAIPASDSKESTVSTKAKAKVDLRVDESDKARWQAEAEARGISVSELVRQRMQTTTASGTQTAPPTNPLTAAEYRNMLAEIDARRALDVSVPELAELRDTLDLRDVDGEHSPLLADWRAYAVLHDVNFGELLEAAVLVANAELVA